MILKTTKKVSSMTKRSNIKKDTKQFIDELKEINPNLKRKNRKHANRLNL